jgi:hypothetical protein
MTIALQAGYLRMQTLFACIREPLPRQKTLPPYRLEIPSEDVESNDGEHRSTYFTSADDKRLIKIMAHHPYPRQPGK